MKFETALAFSLCLICVQVTGVFSECKIPTTKEDFDVTKVSILFDYFKIT